MVSGKYILVDGQPRRCDDVRAWARWFETADTDRIVAKTSEGDVEVSTVFLALDHNFGGGEPLLYETMIFGGPHDGYQERYASREEAERGHLSAVALARGERR
jgi:hypothetical protein